MPTCLDCRLELTNDNWFKSNRKRGVYLCKSCASKRAVKWQREHPNKRHKNTKEYMRTYMKGYRKRHLQRMQELGRLEYHRRERELSTDTILNEHFEGADLHHLTPSTGIYIPKTLHRSVYHNLKTGEGMTEINAKAMDWFK